MIFGMLIRELFSFTFLHDKCGKIKLLLEKSNLLYL